MKKSDNGVTGTVLAVAAVAALAWGISKLLGSSEPEPKRKSDPEDEKSDNGITGMVLAVAAATGVAAWMILGSSEPERHEQMTLSSSPSSSRGMRDQNRNENNITFGQLTQEARTINSGNGNEKWTRPKEGRFKLNTDASVRKQHGHKTGPATAGGVIRNDAGQWIAGFTLKLGVCDSTEAELVAVRKGLRLAWKRGFRELEVETDSEAAVILIKKTDLKYNHPMRFVVEDCRNLLMALDSEIGHVYKEGNKCAHVLAKIVIHPNKRKEVWEHIPNDHVRDVVKSDMQLSLRPHIVLGLMNGYCPACDTITDYDVTCNCL